MIKEHKKEVKGWRKDLGEQTKLKIKLQEKLSKTSENISSGLPIPSLKPVLQSESPEEISDKTIWTVSTNRQTIYGSGWYA